MGAAGKFSCQECGKSYSWKAELAGRRVKCKCGVPLTVPKDDPAAAREEAGFDDLYALAEGTPVETTAAVTPPAFKTPSVVVETGGGGASGFLAYARRPQAQETARVRDTMMFHPVWDLYVPMAFILIGTVLSFVEVMYGRGVRNPGMAMMFVGIFTLINILLGVPGVLMTVKMFDLGLGPIGPAMMKIIACLLFPGAVSGVIIAFVPMGGFVAWAVSYVITVAMFMKMLEMDYTETMICSAIIWLIRTWGTYALIALIFGGFFFGRPGRAGGGGGIGGGVAAVVAGDVPEIEEGPTARDYDEVVEDVEGSNKLTEAKAWLSGGAGRWFQGNERPDCLKMVDDLYSAGATDVQAAQSRYFKDPDEPVRQLVVYLPKDQAARKRLFAYKENMGKKGSVAADGTPGGDEDEEDEEDDEDPDMTPAAKRDKKVEKDLGQKAFVLTFTGVIARDLDRQMEQQLKEAKRIEARAWLTGEVGRVIFQVGHEQSPKLLDELYAMGATKVEALYQKDQNENEACRHLLVTLPDDKAARKKLFDFEAKHAGISTKLRAKGFGTKDIGQRYFTLRFFEK